MYKRYIGRSDINSTLDSFVGRVFSTRASHIVLLAVAYIVFARIGQVFAIPPGNVTAVWIPSGIVLSAMLLKGNYLWPGIFIGAFLGNIWAYCDFHTADNVIRSVVSATCNGVGDSVAAIFGAYFIRRITKTSYPFSKGYDVFVFVFYGAILGSGISAVFGVTSLSLMGFVGWSEYLTVWITWWVGDGVGVLLVSPFLLSLSHWKDWRWITVYSGCEVLLFFVSLISLSLLIVENNVVSTSITLPVILSLPLLMWSVFRFPSQVTFLSIVTMSILIIIEKAQFFGISTPELSDVSILEIQLFMFVVSVTSLILLANKEDKDQVEASLVAANRYNRTLFDELSIGLALCDMDGRLNDVNPAYAAIIGRSIEETKKLSSWDITPEEFLYHDVEQLENLNDNGFYGPYEKEYIHKDGRRIPVILRGKVVVLDEVKYNLSSIEDISDKKECYESLKRAIKDATDANLAKSEFLSSMSHELRTPLNAIIGFSQLLEMGRDKLSKDQHVSVNEIQRGGKHLLALINEILDLSKIESGKISVNMQSISLARIIEESLRLTSSQAEEHGVDIVVAKNTDFTLYCDPLRLKQIVLNYLSNAIKYNNSPGTVSISFREITHDIPGKEYLRIIVSDTGCGLSEKQMTSLFTPFERVGAEKGGVQGTGIGLAISKKLATLMEGGVGVDSTLGEGSDFWVDVLLADAFIQEDLPKEKKHKVPIQTSAPSVIDQSVGMAKVLYIDDNEGNILFIKHAFKLHSDSYSLQTCSNSRQGLALAIESPPELILLDISMPGMDGFEVLKHLKKDKATCEVPVIAVSANAMDIDIEKGMSAGFNGYLCKPFNFSTLMNTVDDNLKG